MLVDNKFIYLSLPRCASTSFLITCLRNNINIKHYNDLYYGRMNETNDLSLDNEKLADQLLHGHEKLVDLRKNSKTFGKYFSIILSNNSYSSIYIPEGFAHGFCTLGKENIIYYMNSNYREKNYEIGILWNDKNLKIKWPIKKPILSEKDSKNIPFEEYCLKYN